ncbi:MAG TPA: PfkB family carbohydrate kinase [Myxococcales bacterium]|jgi:sugar/nucleoside kinase (ribokinase family)
MKRLKPPPERAFDVVGLGEISVDHICVVPRIPGASDKVRMASYEVQGGGQIATAMIACQRLGLKARFLGKVGDDRWGAWSIDELRREGVSASGVRVGKGTTQTAFVMVHATTGERTVVWSCEESLVPDPSELTREEIASGRAFHVDATGLAKGLEPLVWARDCGCLTSIDIDHLLPDTEAALRLVDLCVLPEGFPEEITGEKDLERAMRKLQRLNPDAIVCTTLGTQGCAALDGDELVRVAAFPVVAVDTTACGDVFHAAFVCGALWQMPLRETMRFANAAAALKTRKLGARPGIPTKAEVEAFLKQR